jgi:Cytidylate kinase-like family
MRVVTISATYGAGGGLVGPAVADRLGVPFVDRAIPVAVADDLGISVDDALSRDEQVESWLSRMLVAAAPLSFEWTVGPDHPQTAVLSDAAVLRCTEKIIREVGSEGGVILGRAAAIVLRDHPDAVHVRLDGDPDRRAQQASALLGITEREARDALVRNDKARIAYVRHFYGADPASPQYYHVILDSTRVPLDTCTDVIVAAVESCERRHG